MNKKMIERTREIRVDLREQGGEWFRLQDPKFIEHVYKLRDLFGDGNVRVIQTVLTTYIVHSGWERTGTKKEREAHD